MTLTIYPISWLFGLILGILFGWSFRDAISHKKEIKKWWDSLWGM